MPETEKPLGIKNYGSIAHLPDISGREAIWNLGPHPKRTLNQKVTKVSKP
jgi:hypothetical protein